MLKNLGIYKITYKFEIMKKLWQELFRFEPTEGVIEPGKEANIYAIFNRYNKDINISPQRNSSEIKLSIFEGEKGSKNKDLNIFVNVASYFSKYSIWYYKVRQISDGNEYFSSKLSEIILIAFVWLLIYIIEY